MYVFGELEVDRPEAATSASVRQQMFKLRHIHMHTCMVLDNVDTTRSYSGNEKKIIAKREENCPISIVTCP